MTKKSNLKKLYTELATIENEKAPTGAAEHKKLCKLRIKMDEICRATDAKYSESHKIPIAKVEDIIRTLRKQSDRDKNRQYFGQRWAYGKAFITSLKLVDGTEIKDLSISITGDKGLVITDVVFDGGLEIRRFIDHSSYHGWYEKIDYKYNWDGIPINDGKRYIVNF